MPSYIRFVVRHRIAVLLAAVVVTLAAAASIYGTMLPLTLTVALLADLLLVPALARLGVVRFERDGNK